MANGHYPILIFPNRVEAERNRMAGGGTRIQLPGIDRQRARIAPQLASLQRAFEAKRIRLQQAVPLENPELVLIVEVVGSVETFANAVSRIPGFEWLQELSEDQIAPDEDFHAQDDDEHAAPMSGRLYLLGTNQEALNQLLALWDRYQRNPDANLDRGLAPFKHVFAHLRAIRPWNATDRVDADMRAYWQDQINGGQEIVRFEVEAWHFAAAAKNDATHIEIEALVGGLEGRVLARALISDIAYHGFLIELPAAAVRNILDGEVPQLLLSDRIMFFRPKAQSISAGTGEEEPTVAAEAPVANDQPPVIALLDGLPLANHTLLADRLILDDPDGWEVGYEAKDRVHGTAMASLILYGELDNPSPPLRRRIYVRPVMRPDPNDGFNQRRAEHTPDDVLLIDLIHRAVKRVCEGDVGQAPAAPTVRVINLSMGDSTRIFSREMSPWARLLDWLASRYSVLFIISAGNDPSPLTLETPRDSLGGLETNVRQALALDALIRTSTHRRLMAPAESINALTVGALHSDGAPLLPAVPNRYDLFVSNGLSPLSRIGHGYRRAIKPEILMSGGRTLHVEQYLGERATSTVEPVRLARRPGHRTASPPLPGGGLNETGYCRGTSNAAALASRAAAQAYEAIEALRAESANAPGSQYDAVILKALLVHGAAWGDMSTQLLNAREDLQMIVNGNTRRIAQQDFVTRWLGYGPVNIERAITCTDRRATLLGVGELRAEQAVIFSAPLPPSLAGTREWRRATITLAWISPINPTHQAYRRARLWINRPLSELRVKRSNTVNDKTALRGTVQHEVLEGRDAVAYVDGDQFVCKVNCAADAGELNGTVRFALCVSLEVGVESAIRVYDEIRERIAPPVEIRPA